MHHSLSVRKEEVLCMCVTPCGYLRCHGVCVCEWSWVCVERGAVRTELGHGAGQTAVQCWFLLSELTENTLVWTSCSIGVMWKMHWQWEGAAPFLSRIWCQWRSKISSDLLSPLLIYNMNFIQFHLTLLYITNYILNNLIKYIRKFISKTNTRKYLI